ncbi:MAG: tetratricopeptide repeat protein, partial [Gemmatimonadota bacterium]
EALRREPADTRSHQALGLLRLRRGELAAAERHLRQAVAGLTQYNFSPRDGEAHYELGLVLRYRGWLDEAYACLYRAIWSYAWQAAGYCALAEIDGRRGDWGRALEHLDRALETNVRHLKARNLKVAALRRLGRLTEAEATVQETMELDALDAWSRLEAARVADQMGFAEEREERRSRAAALLRVGGDLGEVQMHLDVAFDCAAAGLWAEAVELLGRLATDVPGEPTHPMVLYARGYLEHQRGDEAGARADYARAAAQPPDYCFPWRVEEMLALEHALALCPGDARAHYYLGNLLFDKHRAEEAMAHWERATELEPGLATPWRNLGIARYNARHDGDGARHGYRRAFEADPSDGRVLCELDQLERRLGAPPEERLRRLEAHAEVVEQRDDLSLARITLLNQAGQPQRALDLMQGRRFIPWEGGEGRVSDQYVAAHLQLGRQALARGDAAAALSHFEAARTFPGNLGEGRSPFQPLIEVEYCCGLAHRALGDAAAARACFARAAEATGGPSPSTYHQALALRQLEREAEADQCLRQLLDHARTQRDTAPQAGFATSVPRFVFEAEDPVRGRRINGNYLMGLAHLGLGQESEARARFAEVLALDPHHQEAQQGLRDLGNR